MRRLSMILLGMIMLAGLSGCQSAPPAAVELTAQDAGRSVELAVGQQLRIRLDGNPTTGYQWARADSDTTILKTLGEPAFTPDSGLIGASGTVILVFEAAKEGQTTLTLHYRRSFEPQAPPAGTFEVQVTVR